MDLENRAKRLGQFFSNSAQRQASATKFARVGLVLIGALLAGGAQFVDNPASGTAWNKVAGFTGVVLAFVGGFWITRTEKDAPAALEEARLAVEEARLLNAESTNLKSEIAAVVSQLRRQHEQLRQLLALVNILREGVERAIVGGTGDLAAQLTHLLMTASRTLLGAMRCEAGERWTIRVYQMKDGLLKSVASCIADRGEENNPSREWEPGEGFAGAAFARDHEIILADAQAPEVQAILVIKAHNKRAGIDGKSYRSVAAVPVRVAGFKDPWGVVIATSDEMGRFDTSQDEPAGYSAQSVRILAGMVALLVAGHQKDASPLENGSTTS